LGGISFRHGTFSAAVIAAGHATEVVTVDDGTALAPFAADDTVLALAVTLAGELTRCVPDR
jgi:hypothetical protein